MNNLIISGYTRVMSSFYWDQYIQNGQDTNSWQGPPHDSNYNTISPEFDSDGACTNGWVCEHRYVIILECMITIFIRILIYIKTDGDKSTIW